MKLQVGPRLAITSSLFFEILFSNIFRKKNPTSYKASRASTSGKKHPSGDSLVITCPQKKCWLRIFLKFNFSDFTASAGLLPPKIDQTLFSNWSLPRQFLKRFCSRQVPHVRSHSIAYFLGFPTFLGRRRKDAPKPVQPHPPTRPGMKYPVPGNPSLR